MILENSWSVLLYTKHCTSGEIFPSGITLEGTMINFVSSYTALMLVLEHTLGINLRIAKEKQFRFLVLMVWLCEDNITSVSILGMRL